MSVTLDKIMSEQWELDQLLDIISGCDLSVDEKYKALMLNMYSEVGELLAETEPAWQYWNRHKTYNIDDRNEELADMLINIIAIANLFGLSPNQFSEIALSKIKRRKLEVNKGWR